MQMYSKLCIIKFVVCQFLMSINSLLVSISRTHAFIHHSAHYVKLSTLIYAKMVEGIFFNFYPFPLSLICVFCYLPVFFLGLNNTPHSKIFKIKTFQNAPWFCYFSPLKFSPVFFFFLVIGYRFIFQDLI